MKWLILVNIPKIDPKSPPAQGAWIEIDRITTSLTQYPVAPCTGGVD